MRVYRVGVQVLLVHCEYVRNSTNLLHYHVHDVVGVESTESDLVVCDIKKVGEDGADSLNHFV